MSDSKQAYTVYIVRCSDATLYTGIAKDITARIHEHNHSPRGARYTKSRRPVELVYQEGARDRSAAQRREYQLRRLSRPEKEKLFTQ